MLLKSQESFLDAVLDHEITPDLLKNIKPVGKLSALDVIQVYQDDYFARLTDALGANYEATWMILGDEDFMSYAQEYIKSHPSHFSSLTQYGESFPDFLKEKNVDAEAPVMAKFERAFWSCFHKAASVAKPLTAEDIEASTCDALAFDLIYAHYNLYDLWLMRENPDPEMSFDDFEGEVHLVLYKVLDRVEVKRIKSIEFQVLTLLQASESLAAVFSDLEERNVRVEQEEWATIFAVLSYCRE